MCVGFDSDISCIDTLIISSNNIQQFNVATESNIALNEICLEFVVFNDSCEPLFSNITLEYVCGMDTIINLISGVQIFPPAYKFEIPVFGVGWDDPVPCSGFPQYSLPECPADYMIQEIYGENDICREMTESASFWVSRPLFDSSGGEQCYENLTDTIFLPPCPVFPSNGFPSIKVVRN